MKSVKAGLVGRECGMPPEIYTDLETHKELLLETQQSWKGCQEELRTSRAKVRELQSEYTVAEANKQAQLRDIGETRVRLADLSQKYDRSKGTIEELRAEIRQYEEQYDWQYSTQAGANAEATEPEVKARSVRQPFERVAEDEERSEVSSPSQAHSRTTVCEEVVDPRAREADRVDVAGWPKPGNFRVWRMSLTDKVVAAAARPQTAFRWITMLNKSGVSYEEMADTSFESRVSFATLDAKLSSALTSVAPSDFLRQAQAKKAEALTTGTMVTGRQILWLIDQHFKMTESDRSIYDTEHIFAVALRGDNLQVFVSMWDNVLVSLGTENRPAPNILETFVRQLRRSKRMEADMAYYDRLPAGHADRTY